MFGVITRNLPTTSKEVPGSLGCLEAPDPSCLSKTLNSQPSTLDRVVHQPELDGFTLDTGLHSTPTLYELFEFSCNLVLRLMI